MNPRRRKEVRRQRMSVKVLDISTGEDKKDESVVIIPPTAPVVEKAEPVFVPEVEPRLEPIFSVEKKKPTYVPKKKVFNPEN